MSFIKLLLNQYKVISILIIIALLFHIIFGIPRWQFYPLYLWIFLYFLLIVINIRYNIGITNKLKYIILATTMTLIFLSAFSLYAFPMEKLPNPSGKYNIGTKTYDIIDLNREAVYSDEINSNRKIKIEIWYPADHVDGYEKAKWIEDGDLLTSELAKNMNLPSFILSHTAKIESNSFINAKISEDKESYPLVIISHGWIGFRELHTDFAEELASNGYIAISIDHSYGSQAVKFENGDIAYLKEEALPDRESTSNFLDYANKLVTSYGEDVKLVIGELEKINEDIHFKDKLDLSKIGLVGHSTGGGGDVYAGLTDDRIDAILGLDAWVEPIKEEKLKEGLKIPSLFIRSNEWEEGLNNKNLFTLIDNSNNSNLYQIDNTSHFDFSMAYMYSPLTRYIGMTGKLDGRRSAKIQREFILNFFDKNLKNISNIEYNDILNKYESIKQIN